MNTLKKIDVYGQWVLILAAVAICFFPATRGLFIIGYFVVGGWQMFSAAIHYCYRDKLLLSRQRTIYQTALFVLVITGLCCLLLPNITMWYLYALLLFSPVMAIWYLAFSSHEWQIWKAKALVHLK